MKPNANWFEAGTCRGPVAIQPTWREAGARAQSVMPCKAACPVATKGFHTGVFSCALLLLCALVTPIADAATCIATSGATRNRLLELYTSEGCSSCPPADRWLSQLPRDSRDSGVVPLAFHVDYWDRLGWKDRFAQAAFSQRQRDRNRGPGWVYTPQLMLDGEDFRNWHRGLPARPLEIPRPGQPLAHPRADAHARTSIPRPKSASPRLPDATHSSISR